MADPNKALCASIWNLLAVNIDRFHQNIVKHSKSVFLGYADVTLVGREGTPLEGFAMKIRGVEVKNLKGNPHIDFPSERGANGTYYPICFPKTAETRMILVTALFGSDEVQAAIVASAEAPMADAADETPAGASAPAATANPFTA